MKRSYRLFSAWGIEIKVHATFLILPIVFGYYYTVHAGWQVGARAVCLVLFVFAFVVMHELAHSFQARRYGIEVPEITLFPIGGVASMRRIPRDPRQEFIIAIVGPLSNFILAVLLFTPLYYLLGRETLFSPSLGSWPQMIANAFWINPVLGLFNLLPAFPMDGGRIFRSLLAQRWSYLTATRVAVWFGFLFAVMFGLFGIFHRNFMLALIGLFVYLAASTEQSQVERQEQGQNHDEPTR